MYNFNWTTSALTGFNFHYNLSDIYFERHLNADPNIKVTMIVGNTE